MEANFLNLIISWQQKTDNSDYFILYVYLYLCVFLYTLTGRFIAYTCYIPHYCIS